MEWFAFFLTSRVRVAKSTGRVLPSRKVFLKFCCTYPTPGCFRLIKMTLHEENANKTQMVIRGGIPPDLVSLDVGEALGQCSSWLRVGITWEL